MHCISSIITLLFAATTVAKAGPRTVDETWTHFDPRKEALETETFREWKNDGVEFRYLRYLVGDFEGRKPRVAAFYAFPEGGRKLPAIVQVHGGGQRAQSETVRYWASQGYAALAVNWGELPTRESQEGPNTDWAGIAAGFLEPKHHNPVSPRAGTLHDTPHPWNSSWLLYAAAARRAITFLERQPEVDGDRIGVTGHSMGGRLTVLTSIDPRVKAASPSVGGSGYLYENIRGIPDSARHMREHLELYKKTVDCAEYWPLIKCPLMFLGATNDFNSPMEKVICAFHTLPKPNGMLSFTPHMNHRFTADNYAARVRWFETHLKGAFDFPGLPKLRPDFTNPRRVGVMPDTATKHKLNEVRIFFGYDRDPRVRFWRSAIGTEQSGYMVECPVIDLSEPLFVFANVTYDTGEELTLPRGYRPTSLLTLSTPSITYAPHILRSMRVTADDKRERLIDEFDDGWRDWSLVSPDNAHHFKFKTHKVNDPAYFGPRGAALALAIETTAPGNTLAVIMETDQWRGYTGRKLKRYVALAKIPEAGSRTVTIPMKSFATADGEVLEHYDHVTALILRPGDKENPTKVKNRWQGKVPVLGNLRWEGGEFHPRPEPYLGEKHKDVDPEAAFRD